MDPSLFFGVRVLDQLYLGVRTEPLNLRDCNKVVDAFTVELEVEAGVLESIR